MNALTPTLTLAFQGEGKGKAMEIQELFAEFGPVSVRRMFGGAGIFVDGRMIGLVSRDAMVVYVHDLRWRRHGHICM